VKPDVWRHLAEVTDVLLASVIGTDGRLARRKRRGESKDGGEGEQIVV
jgi:hypothetical protein